MIPHYFLGYSNFSVLQLCSLWELKQAFFESYNKLRKFISIGGPMFWNSMLEKNVYQCVSMKFDKLTSSQELQLKVLKWEIKKFAIKKSISIEQKVS